MRVPIIRILGASVAVLLLLVALAYATSPHSASSQDSASPEHPASPSPPAAAHSTLKNLTRYPYLTDVVADGATTDATVNWATDESQGTAFVTYQEVGAEPSTAHRIAAHGYGITVLGVPEYQWKAEVTGLKPGVAYVYRVFLGDPALDLLGADPSPRFTTPPAPGSSTPFSFAVLGDWGATNRAGTNPSQARLDAQIAASPASFVLSAGDTAYPSGTQSNYGNLFQTGVNVSAVFGSSFYRQIGAGRPMFPVPGNHGLNSTLLDVWPESNAARLSNGRYQMAVAGPAAASSHPSVWYAFTIGGTRFYMLTAAWADSDLGSGTLYSNDYAAHWTPSSPEYRWLAHDLATDPSPIKIAVFHFPMYSDNRTEASDPYFHQPGGLASLLSRYGVDLVFNGHAHVYERNRRRPGDSFVSYITGTGGGRLASLGRTSPFDAYGIGWSPATDTGRATGSAKPPTSPDQVYSFLLVTVSGSQVTVKPINALGQAFDVMTYQF